MFLNKMIIHFSIMLSLKSNQVRIFTNIGIGIFWYWLVFLPTYLMFKYDLNIISTVKYDIDSSSFLPDSAGLANKGNFHLFRKGNKIALLIDQFPCCAVSNKTKTLIICIFKFLFAGFEKRSLIMLRVSVIVSEVSIDSLASIKYPDVKGEAIPELKLLALLYIQGHACSELYNKYKN